MAKPDFLVIGAQKAGTTWLDKMFKSHPDIWTPVVKELQFFNDYYMPSAFKWTNEHRKSHSLKGIEYAISNPNDIDWNKIKESVHIGSTKKIDIEWYEKVFDYAPSGKVKGEMTPEYSLLNEEHVEKMSKIYPDVKIILVIRDPVERALSGIKMRLLQNGVDETDINKINEFVISASSDWDVIERSNYESIIKKYNQYFNDSNIKVYLSEDFINKPRESLDSIASFLSVDSTKFRAEITQRIHVGKKYNIGKEAIESVKINQESNSSWFAENKDKFKVL